MGCMRIATLIAACLLAAVAPFAADAATPVAVEVATLDASGADVTPAAVLDGTYDAQFRIAPDGRARFAGGRGRIQWLRLAFELPPIVGDEEAAWVLALERAPLEQITLHVARPGGGFVAQADGFYAPAAEGAAAAAYAVALREVGAGRQVAYASIRGSAPVILAPRIVPRLALHRSERRFAALQGGVAALLAGLLVSALAFWGALRDRGYLYFVLFAGALLVLLAALDGVLYRLAGLAWFGWWGGNGVAALAFGCAAASLGLTREVLESARTDVATARWIGQLRIGCLVLAVLCLLNLDLIGGLLQRLAAVTAVGVAAYHTFLGARAARRNERFATGYAAAWLALTLAVGLRVADAAGWIDAGAARHVVSIVAPLAALVFSIALGDRVLEFRRQRDRARQQKESADASLQVEQARRLFGETLRNQLRPTTPEADLTWIGLKQVLISLRQVLPHDAMALVANGYHGGELLLSEPLDAKDRFARVVAARSGSLKSLCRSRKPVQLQLGEKRGTSGDGDESEPPGTYAVVPMALLPPSWGALIIARAAGEGFDARELKLAAEFLDHAVAATDEAVAQAALRRKAEIDALTGAYNRREGDQTMQAALEQAMAERQPMSMLVIDVDHLKALNEKHGRPAGDEALRRLAAAIRGELQHADLLIRYDGDKFLVVLPGQPLEQARRFGEKIRLATQQLRPDGSSGQARFTVSGGVAARLPSEEQAQSIAERALRALQTAKRNGRNQVQVQQQVFGAVGAVGVGAPADDTLPL